MSYQNYVCLIFFFRRTQISTRTGHQQYIGMEPYFVCISLETRLYKNRMQKFALVRKCNRYNQEVPLVYNDRWPTKYNHLKVILIKMNLNLAMIMK